MPVAVGIDAEGDQLVEQQVAEVDEGEDDTEERGDSHELGEEKRGARAGCGAEEAKGDEAPEAGTEVDGDGTTRVVDEELQLEGFDEERDECSSDDADEQGGERRGEAATGASGYEAGDPSVSAEGGVRLAVAELGDEDGGEAATGGGEHRVDGNDDDLHGVESVEEHGSGGFEADPADESEQAAEEDEDDVVTGDCGRDVVGVLALARAEDPGDGEGGEASCYLEDGCTSCVGEGGKAEEGGELGEPAGAPDPVGEEREDEAGEEGAGGADGGETPAVAAGADGDERSQTDGAHLEGEDESWVRAAEQAGVEVRGEEGFGSEPVPLPAGELEGVGEAAGVSSQGGADEDEDDGGDGEGTERREHRVGGAAGAAETLMDESETGCRERNEEDAEKADSEVHLEPRWRER